MNIHIDDKFRYYLPLILKLDNIAVDRLLEWAGSAGKEITPVMIGSWEEALEHEFTLDHAVILALFHALKPDEKKSRQYLRLIQRKKGVLVLLSVVHCLLLSELNRFDEAIKILKALSGKVRGQSFIMRLEADINFDLKEYRRAEAIYLKVIKENPGDSSVLSRLGEIHLILKKYEDAEKFLKASVKVNDKNVMAHYYLGDIYKLTQRIDLAKKEYGLCASINFRHNASKTAKQKLFLLCCEDSSRRKNKTAVEKAEA